MNNLISLLYSFGKIGLISLGGGNSMLKLIEFEAVTNQQWLLPDEFVQMVGTTFLFPGLTAVKLAGLIGYKTAGITGLILAIISLNLPGLFLALLGYRLLSHSNSPMINRLSICVQYGALSLLAAASFSIGQSIFNLYYSLPIAILSILFFIALVYFPLSPFWGFLAFIGIGFFMVR